MEATKKFGVILAIDDMPMNLRILRIFLEKYFEVIPVKSGLEGISVIERRNDINVILLDIEMPVMSGFEFMEKLHELPGDKAKIPVICVTGLDATPDFIKDCIRKGARDYVTKPVEPDILKPKVCKILGIESYLLV